MSTRKVEFAENEWYHCYNRGAGKHILFHDTSDYVRFLLLMYSCNGTSAIHLSKVARDLLRAENLPGQGEALTRVLCVEDFNMLTRLQRGNPLVKIGAYCLMPNHFHMLLSPLADKGISGFMQKVCTSYTMYYNKKYDHSGVVLQGAFNAKHIDDDIYLQRVVSYIHANPLDIISQDWQSIENDMTICEKLAAYQFSSLQDMQGFYRPQVVLLDAEFQEMMSVKQKRVESIFEEARIFAQAA